MTSTAKTTSSQERTGRVDTISRVETFLVPPRWLFVRIETRSGVVGWGEASLEGHSDAVRTVVDQFAEQLVGSDPGGSRTTGRH